jgi:hypothetical protein
MSFWKQNMIQSRMSSAGIEWGNTRHQTTKKKWRDEKKLTNSNKQPIHGWYKI